MDSVVSSSHLPGHDEQQSFFESGVENPTDNGWTPNEDIGNGPYIEYTFNTTVVIATVVTMDTLNEEESDYTMDYLSGSDFIPVTEKIEELDEFGKPIIDQMRQPLNDENGKANRNHLDETVTTTKVRLYPGTSNVQMKVAFYGCLPEEVATTPVVSVTSREITETTTSPVTESTAEQTTSTLATPAEQTSLASEKPTEQATSTTGSAAQTSSIVLTTTEKLSTAKPTTIESVTVETTTETTLSASSQATSSTPFVPNTGTTKVVTTTTRAISTIATEETPSTLRCDENLGMDANTDSEVNFDIVTSNVDEPKELRNNVRLNSVDSWTPTTTGRPYVGVEFKDLPVTVTAVLIQEDEKTGYSVSEVVIEYTSTTNENHTILEESSGDEKRFIVNYNDSGIGEVKLPNPLKDVKQIRIVPMTQDGKIAIRMELKGCFVKEETTTATQTSKTIVTTKTVPSTPREYTGSPTTTTKATGMESTTPEITVTTIKTMPVTSEVSVTSTPKFSTKPISGTTRTTEKVSISIL